MKKTRERPAREPGERVFDGITRKYFAVPHDAGEPGDESILITTSAVDHYGDRVFPAGANLGAYLKNPVILWAHDSYGDTASAGIPIGTTRSLEIVPNLGIRASGIDWLEGDEFAGRVRNAWDQGKIRAASIGFMVDEDGWDENEYGGYDITAWTLLEWSLVPVPANPEAVRARSMLKSLGLDRAPAEAPSPILLKAETDPVLAEVLACVTRMEAAVADVAGMMGQMMAALDDMSAGKAVKVGAGSAPNTLTSALLRESVLRAFQAIG